MASRAAGPSSGPSVLTPSNRLIIADSETDANIYYATRFLAPDPFIYLQANDQSHLLMSDLELDRARKQSKVTHVHAYSDYEKKAKSSGIAQPSLTDIVHTFIVEQGFEKNGNDEWLVPDNFPLFYGDRLRASGHKLLTVAPPFFKERALKTEKEVAAIRLAQQGVEATLDEVLEDLRNAEIKEGLLYLNGTLLTSESVRRTLHLGMMEKGLLGQHTIVSCGRDACDPHNEGSGPLRANEAIIFDIFPRSIESRYHSDMTRTVVKGNAPDQLKRLYDTVLEGQLLGISQVQHGADGQEIHATITRYFEKQGYETGLRDGRMQGFFHGTGHGIGLDIHEPPRIGKIEQRLQAGEVVTVEPGLYYPEIGAVRIEDMVLVTENGCRNLTSYQKKLEL